MDILKPCPFCGGKVQMDSKEFFDGLVEEHGYACLSIQCKNCNTYHYCHHPSTDYYEKAEIITRSWNHRV